MSPGETLKRLRIARGITVRQVEQASNRIAAAKRNQRFHISNGWLAQVENGASEPSICKLFTLSVIYKTEFVTLIKLYDIDLDETDKYRVIAAPSQTHALRKSFQAGECSDCEFIEVASTMETSTVFVGQSSKQKTCLGRLLHLETAECYGYVGLNDLTMYPLIRPGSLVCIDSKQTTCRLAVWHNEYERPIYFIALRNGYACGWCEVDGNRLLVIPHHLSPVGIRQFPYPREAEIIGRVIGFNTSCVVKAKHAGGLPGGP